MNLENLENPNNGWMADSLIRSEIVSPTLHPETPSSSSSRQSAIHQSAIHQFAVQRALLLPIGETAVTVARQAFSISQSWLQLQSLPLLVVDSQSPDPVGAEKVGAEEVGAEEVGAEEVGAIVAACNRLADSRLVRKLQSQGYLLKHTNEINLWVLLAIPAAGDNLTHLSSLIEEATEQVRATLKVQVTAHLLLLCEPQHQKLAASWAGTLLAYCEQRIYLCSPVNQQHLRLDGWEEQAGTTLAGLLWSERSHLGVARWNDPASCWVRAVGATGWRVPNTELHNWLACRWVAQQLCLLEGKKSDKSLQSTVPSILPELAFLEQRLAACVPPIPQPQPQTMRLPHWSQLSSMALRLQRSLETLLVSRSSQQSEARSGWLAGALAQFAATLATDKSPGSATALPTLAGLQEEQVDKRQSLFALSDAVEERLSTIETAIADQQQHCLQLQGVLRESCKHFPDNTHWGVLRALTSPWYWWHWASIYLVDLPEQSQQWIQAEIGLAQKRWEQNNLLTIRQLALALLQDLRQQERDCEVMAEQIAALKLRLSERERQLAESDLSPWNAQQLASWLNRVTSDDLRWQQQMIRLTEISAKETSALFDRYWQAALEINRGILSGSVSQMLDGALPELALRQAWLAQQWEDATPLWPSENLIPSEESVDWLLLAAAETGNLQGEMPVHCQPGLCHFPGLLIVREVAVNLAMGVEGESFVFEIS